MLVVQRRSVILGITFGLIIVAIGLFFIFGKDFLWSVTQSIYNILGIQSTRTQGWEMLTSAIGTGIVVCGAFLIWTVNQIRRNSTT
jgi:nitrogen fixation-related uncharacterized protein